MPALASSLPYCADLQRSASPVFQLFVERLHYSPSDQLFCKHTSSRSVADANIVTDASGTRTSTSKYEQALDYSQLLKGVGVPEALRCTCQVGDRCKDHYDPWGRNVGRCACCAWWVYFLVAVGLAGFAWVAFAFVWLFGFSKHWLFFAWAKPLPRIRWPSKVGVVECPRGMAFPHNTFGQYNSADFVDFDSTRSGGDDEGNESPTRRQRRVAFAAPMQSRALAQGTAPPPPEEFRSRYRGQRGHPTYAFDDVTSPGGGSEHDDNGDETIRGSDFDAFTPTRNANDRSWRRDSRLRSRSQQGDPAQRRLSSSARAAVSAARNAHEHGYQLPAAEPRNPFQGFDRRPNEALVNTGSLTSPVAANEEIDQWHLISSSVASNPFVARHQRPRRPQ